MPPPKQRLLRVEAPHFVAAAVWEQRAGGWACVQAAPILAWMRAMTPAQAKDYLTRKRWPWQWLDWLG
jgi:hypothetical protein